MPITNDFEPAAYSGRGATARGLPLDPSRYPDTRLMYHPRRWQFFPDEAGGGEWLPNLAELHLVPGLNCVQSDGDVSLAYAERMRAGWVILDSPGEVGRYLVEYEGQPTRSGRIPRLYLLRWMVPRIIAGTAQVRYDRDAHLEYLRELVASGRFAADAEQIELLRGRVQDERDRDEGESTGDGKAARRAKAATELLARMDAAGMPQPVPPPAPRRARVNP
jgi:hypothetical protein